MATIGQKNTARIMAAFAGAGGRIVAHSDRTAANLVGFMAEARSRHLKFWAEHYVLAVLEEGPATAHELRDRLGVGKNTIRTVLARLEHDGRVERDKHGWWQTPARVTKQP